MDKILSVINMDKLIWETPEEINMAVALRLREIRKRRKISQEKLALMSGVSFGSIKRFEQTGNISLISLTKISFALGCQNEIRNLFATVPYESIREVINGQK